MRKIIEKLHVIIAFIIITPQICCAQLSLINAIDRMPTESIPFDARTAYFSNKWGAAIVNPNNIIPDRLYDNVQLTMYSNASLNISSGVGGVAFRKFTIPNTSFILLVVSFGGVSPDRTDVLCVVNNLGAVINSLEGLVIGYEIYIKQFRINAQNEIIVSTIKTTSSTSIPLSTFTSFTGYRQDITYSINSQGQFVQIAQQTFLTRTFTRAELGNDSVNLWDLQ